MSRPCRFVLTYTESYVFIYPGFSLIIRIAAFTENKKRLLFNDPFNKLIYIFYSDLTSLIRLVSVLVILPKLVCHVEKGEHLRRDCQFSFTRSSS